MVRTIIYRYTYVQHAAKTYIDATRHGNQSAEECVLRTHSTRITSKSPDTVIIQKNNIFINTLCTTILLVIENGQTIVLVL